MYLVTQQQLVPASVIPDAVVFNEHGTFFVGVCYDIGIHIWGWGETANEAVEAANRKYES